MATVNSVLGPIDTANLGFTLMHEHVMFAAPGIYHTFPELLDDNPVERAVDWFRKAKEGEVDTIVDATTHDMDRNVDLMAIVSRRSGVNIIASTGWYEDIPVWIANLPVNKIADLFIREIEQGIAGTNTKPGILKAASDIHGVTPQAETMLRAVARAHLKTGIPIMLHSYSPGRVGVKQLAILQEEGVDLKRVKMDHCNDTTDIEYLFWLLDQGCYLGMDRYPGRNVSPLARTRTLKVLIDAGYAGRLCLSHDFSTLVVEAAYPKMFGISIEERRKRNPYGFLYLKEVVFPQLREMGVSEAALNRLCVDGPRNFFEGV